MAKGTAIEFFSLALQQVGVVDGFGSIASAELVGSTLYVADREADEIAVVDLDSLEVVDHLALDVPVDGELVHTGGYLYFAPWGSPDHLNRVDPATGARTSVPLAIGEARPTVSYPSVVAAPTPGHLFLQEWTGSPPRLFELDVTGPTATVVRSRDLVASETAGRFSVSPDGSTIYSPFYTASGGITHVTKTSDFSDAGSFAAGWGNGAVVEGGTDPVVATESQQTYTVEYHDASSPYGQTGSDRLVGQQLGTLAFGPDGTLYATSYQGPDGGAHLQLLFPAGTPGAGFHPLPGTRLLDTRDGTGAPSTGPVPQGGTIELQVTGRPGVPPSGVSSVVLNVTVTEPTLPGFLTLFPTGLERPWASSLNFVRGQTVANLVTVPVGAGGKVSIYNSAGSSHVVADIAGWYDDDGTGFSYHPVTPSRVLDTRDGTNSVRAPIGERGHRVVPIAGHGGVPPTGATSVMVNITATGTTEATFATVWPAGSSRPTASNLNLVAGDTRPNLVVVPLGVGGAIDIYNHAGSADFVADVVGWFDDGTVGGAQMLPNAPVRLIDTREDFSRPLGPGELFTFDIAPALPSDASALVLNVTVVDGTASSVLSVTPTGTDSTRTSSLNWLPGQVNANQVVVPLGPDGGVQVRNWFGEVEVVIDFFGYFVG